MLALRTQNLRCLKDTGFLELKPLTLLVGRNSSGKSSFLRFLPLIRQSMESQTRGPIRWFGSLVDFGSFQETVHRNGQDPWLSFAFQVDDNFSFELRLKYNESNETTWIEGLDVRIDGNAITQQFDEHERLKRLTVNDTDLTDDVGEDFDLLGFIPLIQYKGVVTLSQQSLLQEMVNNKIKPFSQGQEVVIPPGSVFRDPSRYAFPREVLVQNPTENQLKDIQDSWLAAVLLISVQFAIRHTFESMQIHYTQPARANAQRSYRWDELQVDRIDANGSNLAMVLSSFKQMDAFSQWTLHHFGFEIFVERLGANVSLYLQEKDSDKKHNLADTGFGYSQILPMITQLYMILHPETPHSGPVFFFMEQPELHLHPQLQALLVDAMAAAVQTARETGVDLRLIMETHSQIMTNRIGQHICFRKDLSPDDTVVYLFEKSGSEASVRPAHYNQKGMLTDWPLEFFAPALLD